MRRRGVNRSAPCYVAVSVALHTERVKDARQYSAATRLVLVCAHALDASGSGVKGKVSSTYPTEPVDCDTTP